MSIHAIIALVALVLAIAVGWQFKVNYGLIAIAVAYILGVCIMRIPSGQIIGSWPVPLFFSLTSVTLFFGIAISNGTMTAIAQRLIYPFRSKPAIIPIVLFLIAAVIGGIGPGATCMFFLAPVYMEICYELKIPKHMNVMMILGCVVGGFSPLGLNGITAYNVLIASGLSEEAAYRQNLALWGQLILYLCLWFVVNYFAAGCHKLKQTTINLTKPQPLSKQQKMNLGLIIILMAVVLLPAILKSLFPTVAVFATINGKVSVQLLCILLTVAATFLNLAEAKKAIADIPWNLIIMICGVTILIGVAQQAGAIDAVSNFVTNHVSSVILISVILTISGGFMSFFSDLLAVVLPTLFPIVVSICAAMPQLNCSLLLACVTYGAITSGLSPFSTLGAVSMSSIHAEDQTKCFNSQIVLALTGVLFGLAYAVVMAAITYK